MEYLLDFNRRSKNAPKLSCPRPLSKEEEKPEFALPLANENNCRVFAFLRKRGMQHFAA